MKLFWSNKNHEFYVQSGEFLTCKGVDVPIVNGIPRFVQDGSAAPFGEQWNAFRTTQLDSVIGFDLSEERLRRCLGEELWSTLEGKLVLEAGCGAGRFTEILLKRGAIVVSVDLSSAVDANAKNFPMSESHYVAQADIYNLPFDYNFFDVVICLGVVQHTPDSKETIRKLLSHLKPGGALVFDHYRLTLSFLTRLLPVYRFLLKFIDIKDTLNFTRRLVTFFLPIHKLVGKNFYSYAVLSRFSPIVTYYHSFPELNDVAQRDWSIMDTHDSLFDYYKRLLTHSGLVRILQDLDIKHEQFSIMKGGIGFEVKVIK